MPTQVMLRQTILIKLFLIFMILLASVFPFVSTPHAFLMGQNQDQVKEFWSSQNEDYFRYVPGIFSASRSGITDRVAPKIGVYNANRTRVGSIELMDSIGWNGTTNIRIKDEILNDNRRADVYYLDAYGYDFYFQQVPLTYNVVPITFLKYKTFDFEIQLDKKNFNYVKNVPIRSTMWLFGLGLIGLLLIRRSSVEA